MSAIDEHWARTRASISSISPHDAAERYERGALLVDTRPEAQRSQHGEIPGALTVERNVLEWRLDPTSAHRQELVTSTDQTIVVFCQEGYSSVLAVEGLAGLGLTDVHDLAGGFQAWAAAGLPTRPAHVQSTEVGPAYERAWADWSNDDPDGWETVTGDGLG